MSETSSPTPPTLAETVYFRNVEPTKFPSVTGNPITSSKAHNLHRIKTMFPHVDGLSKQIATYYDNESKIKLVIKFAKLLSERLEKDELTIQDYLDAKTREIGLEFMDDFAQRKPRSGSSLAPRVLNQQTRFDVGVCLLAKLLPFQHPAKTAILDKNAELDKEVRKIQPERRYINLVSSA